MRPSIHHADSLLDLPKTFHSGSFAPPWGDGFVDDTLAEIARTDDWDLVSSDEFLRLYPRLLKVPSARLREHVERAIATLFVQFGPERFRQLHCITAQQAVQLASLHSPRWSPSPAKHYLDVFVASELPILDEFLYRLRAGATPVWEVSTAEVVAFHTGVHPAYFWSQAVASCQHFTTLGWLGLLMRGRRALMPSDVAEYLVECLADPDGDPQLLKRMGSRKSALRHLRNARRRLLGRDVLSNPFSGHTRRFNFSWGGL